MIVIIDYDTGNIRSIQAALSAVGLPSQLSDEPEMIEQADGLILPGVGAYPAAMQKLVDKKLCPVIKRAAADGKPILGICLGMQLLLEGSLEHQMTDGLGLIPGICRPLPERKDFPVPHMGWNQLTVRTEHPLTKGIAGQWTYFVHSFYADCPADMVLATADYAVAVPAIIARDNIFGIQFHPEKSAGTGLNILQNFKEAIYS